MGRLTAELVVGIVGLVVGLVGVMFAVRERMLKGLLDRSLKAIEETREREIWTMIGIDCTGFDALDIAKTLALSREKVDHEVLTKIESGRRSIVDLYRMLLQEAVALERDFSMLTIQKWKLAGRLENEWRVKAAMRLLPTVGVPDLTSKDLQSDKMATTEAGK